MKDIVPRDFCYVCGNKNTTIHHLRMDDIHSKKKRKLNGLISLCEDCHRVVEDIVNKGKARKLWLERGKSEARENEFDFLNRLDNSILELVKHFEPNTNPLIKWYVAELDELVKERIELNKNERRNTR